MENIKVGVVMLTYNRADIVVPCLHSLCYAKNDIPFEIFVLDNNSVEDQYEKIKKEFENFRKEGKIKGVLNRSGINNGFPKGNNIGIKYFIGRDDITHICLINSDVIVTDGWLDKLVFSGFDAVGPVTNSCGNEQTIPLPFGLRLKDDNFSIINDFSKERERKFKSSAVKTDFLGFFCFLAKKEVFVIVGYLDEQFGMGAFEDDDYCLRILENNYQMFIMRDTFVYHWGSSSFSQISYNKLTKHLETNRTLFEKKHSIKWVDRKWLPMKSFQQDMDYLLKRNCESEIKSIFDLYYSNVEKLAKSIALSEKVNANSGKIIARVPFTNLTFVRKLKKASRLVIQNKNILFLVRFPSNEDLKDGYFQRVNAIDNFLSEYNRFYVNYRFDSNTNRLFPEVVKIKDKVYEIRPYVKNPMHLFIVLIMAVVFGKIYMHSILRLQSKFNRFLFLISRKRILDIHGVVPEEFKMHGDLNGHETFNKIEQFAVRRADVVIGVTKRMIDHVLKKHDIKYKRNVIILPILPETKDLSESIFQKKPNTIIYCGGLQKWQQVEKMLEFVRKEKELAEFTFLVPEPQKLKEVYKELYGEEFFAEVTSTESSEVSKWYAKNSFGLVLREDIIVNNAACPTKLIEYFQNDVVPIVDSENIGDFKELGYRYVSYKDKLPDEKEWREIILQNRKVLKKIYEMFENGAKELRKNI